MRSVEVWLYWFDVLGLVEVRFVWAVEVRLGWLGFGEFRSGCIGEVCSVAVVSGPFWSGCKGPDGSA